MYSCWMLSRLTPVVRVSAVFHYLWGLLFAVLLFPIGVLGCCLSRIASTGFCVHSVDHPALENLHEPAKLLLLVFGGQFA